jgi:hypothetical protein
MAKFARKVQAVLPPDNELVIGTVGSIPIAGTPGTVLTVNVRGGTVTNPGRLSNVGVDVGDVVALLRQNGTWLIMGVLAAAASAGLGLSALQMSQMTGGAQFITAVETTVAGTSITFNTTLPNATVLAMWVVDLEAVGANTTTGTVFLQLDGVSMTTPAVIGRLPTDTQRSTLSQCDIFTVAGAGTHTLQLRAIRVSGSDVTLRMNPTSTTLTIGVFQ